MVSKPLQKFQGSSAKTQNKSRAMVATEKVRTPNLIAPAQLKSFLSLSFFLGKKRVAFFLRKFSYCKQSRKFMCFSFLLLKLFRTLFCLSQHHVFLEFMICGLCLKFSSLMHDQNVLCLLIVMYEFYGLIAKFWWLR